MYLSVNKLMSYDVFASDGELGHIKDILFDDKQWTVRYALVDTSKWMPLSEKVLITPVGIQEIDNDEESISLRLDKETLSECPPLDAHKPISQEYEEAFFDFFGYGYYWNGLGLWGDFSTPEPLVIREEDELKEKVEGIEKKENKRSSEYQLRSVKEVNHYDIVEVDGMKGHIHDFLIHQENWCIEFLVIDTRNWIPGGKKVLINPHFVEQLNWKDQAAYCKLTIKDFESLPEYSSELLKSDEKLAALNAQLEQLLKDSK